MTSAEPRPDIFEPRTGEPLAEPLLLQAVRDGSDGAFAILYARHRDHAVAVAGRALPAADASLAEDVAEIALLRTFTALRNGKGPSDTLRFYLSTTVRREAWRAQRRRRRQGEILDQWATEERALQGAEDDPVATDETAEPDDRLQSHALLAEAFGELPDRWRSVLWLTEVEGRKPAEVAPLLGLTAGSAAALAYRARKGLVSTYLRTYREHRSDLACQDISDRLADYVASGRPDQGFDDVTAHLEGCASCRDVIRGVDVVGGALRGVVPIAALSSGLWVVKGVGVGAAAKAVAAGGAALGAKAAVGAAGSSSAGGAGAGGAVAGAAAGGWMGAAVAAAVAVVVVAAGAYAGFGSPDSPAPKSEQAGVVQPEGRSTTTSRKGPSATSPTASVESATITIVSPPAREAEPAEPVVRDPDPVATTVPATSAVPTTQPTASPATTSTTRPVEPPTTTTTSTTVPPLAPAQLSGRVVESHPELAGQVPLPNVEIRAIDGTGRVVGTAVTGADGAFLLKDLPAGRYQVVALVPPELEQAGAAPTPTPAGPWLASVGTVDLTGVDATLPSLVLTRR